MAKAPSANTLRPWWPCNLSPSASVPAGTNSTPGHYGRIWTTLSLPANFMHLLSCVARETDFPMQARTVWLNVFRASRLLMEMEAREWNLASCRMDGRSYNTSHRP